MNKIIQLIILLFLSVGNLKAQDSIRTDNEVISVIDEFTGRTEYEVEKVGLQIWYVLKTGNWDVARGLLVDYSELEKLPGIINKPVDYQWLMTRRVADNSNVIIDMFVSYPQYTGEPERKPFLQIKCTKIVGGKFETMNVIQGQEIETPHYRKSFFPNQLPLDKLYLVKDRTLRTVIDSLSNEGHESELYDLSKNILESLQNTKSIDSSHIMKLTTSYSSSENTYFPLKIFGDYYNRHYSDESHFMHDRYVKNSNYYVRDAILECLDYYLKTADNYKPYLHVSSDSCTSISDHYTIDEVIREARSNLAKANNTEAIRYLLNTNLPIKIKKEIEFFCETFSWLESRYPEMKKGRESYSRLENMSTNMVRRMLNIMSDAE